MDVWPITTKSGCQCWIDGFVNAPKPGSCLKIWKELLTTFRLSPRAFLRDTVLYYCTALLKKLLFFFYKHLSIVVNKVMGECKTRTALTKLTKSMQCRLLLVLNGSKRPKVSQSISSTDRYVSTPTKRIHSAAKYSEGFCCVQQLRFYPEAI